MEGISVTDISLDTWCSRTPVRQRLVSVHKLKCDHISVKCACGCMMDYPLAKVKIMMGKKKMIVEAGVSDTLPTSELLGTDVPDVVELLQESGSATQDSSDQGMRVEGSH